MIPEHAECEIDVRFSKMSEAERVDAALRSIQLDRRTRLARNCLATINRPPLERTAAVVGVIRKCSIESAASFGYEVGETQVGGASDGNFVAALGVPVLDGLGMPAPALTRLDEHILVSDIANTSDVGNNAVIVSVARM